MPVKASVIAMILFICLASVSAFGAVNQPYVGPIAEGKSGQDDPSIELLEFLGEWEIKDMEWVDSTVPERMMESDNEGGDYDNAEK